MTLMIKILPYLAAFLGSLVLTLALTPIVRELNRRLGMVDKPDPRRINKVPIPRGGGLAIVAGVLGSYAIFLSLTGRAPDIGTHPGAFVKIALLSSAIALVGLLDDRFSLSPRLKLLGQILVAVATWWWVGVGFRDLWPMLPIWVDCLFTTLWIVGAVNAFNLIDGLDGLASGLALIAVMGMAGGVFFTASPGGTFFYFAMMGGLLGFLRYNYNPASVFLGDCGSMFLGFIVSTLPLLSHVPNSFLISIGVPLLAMGVPIFDTALAILRRSIRHILNKRSTSGAVGNDKVMTADADHLHHRLLRSMGMSQRRTAWTLYALAASSVAVGLVGLSLQSRAAGLWLLALAAASVVIFRDMAKIELYDAGRLLNSMAHNPSHAARRRWARLSVPFFVAYDLFALIAVFFLTAYVLGIRWNEAMFRAALPLRVATVFGFLIAFKAYSTAWSRAVGSNYLRIFLACLFGSVVGAALLYYAPSVPIDRLGGFTLVYMTFSFVTLLFVRVVRGYVRDIFYAIDCSRLKGRKDVSRILVYGGDLRYQAFRRELVRKTSANDRIIVGILDDDITLRGKCIGGIRVLGTINQAEEIINATNADCVVIACDVTSEWLGVVRQLLAPTGVKISVFDYSEKTL